MADIGITLTSPDASKQYKFEDHYILGEKIAKGSFGVVSSAVHKKSKEEVAVKIINREKLSKKDKEGIFREVEILKECSEVEGIVRLLDFYSSSDALHVVQVYAQGGDVFERLAKRNTYNERDARNLAKNLLSAIGALHKLNIAHRDLKPENLLLQNMLDDTSILLADFGFAAHVPEDGLKTRCGTPAFVAPELLVPDCRYDERADMWSVGCLLYMLLGGYPPFQDENHRGLFRKIRGGDFIFHEAYWKNVSVSAKQVISALLTPDPDYRVSAGSVLEKSNWLKIKDFQLEKNDLSMSLGEIQKFHAKTTLKGAVHAVIWSMKSKFKVPTKQKFNDQMDQWDKDDEAHERVNMAFQSTGKPTLKFEDVYELKKEIHRSKASTIWECLHKKKNEIFAVKRIDRKLGASKLPNGKNLESSILQELAVLRALKHKNIISIEDFFESPDYLYLVMENMAGGDVFDKVSEVQKYTEKDARDLAKQLLEAVNHMHKAGFVHRDLKPQNLLLKTKSSDSDIKIGDFGFAARVHTPQSLTTRCGTPSYVAPEILKNIPYDQSVDMWSVGVMLYVLLCGYPPFADQNQNNLFRKIRTGEWEFKKEHSENISDDAKALIKRLLVADPLRRISAEEALKSSWFTEDDAQLSMRDLPGVVESVKKNHKKTFRAVAQTVMIINRLKGSIGKNSDDDEHNLGVEANTLEAVENVMSRPERGQDGTQDVSMDLDVNMSSF